MIGYHEEVEAVERGSNVKRSRSRDDLCFFSGGGSLVLSPSPHWDFSIVHFVDFGKGAIACFWDHKVGPDDDTEHASCKDEVCLCA